VNVLIGTVHVLPVTTPAFVPSQLADAVSVVPSDYKNLIR
jgi:hypothetical protein